ncbi:MAG: tannase/feruloyl esterase family alpha/beta hydrolase [Acidobacteriota bacterium]|nr:tannase/feruloyl esterase family alpha/beta hydrolase [Acidobacteriota bacterium]
MKRLGTLLAVAAIPAFSATCDSLSSLHLKDAAVSIAQAVGAGAFVPPGGPGRGPGANAFKALPAFCRVAVTLTPTPDSDIKVEVWMPASNWNGKFQAVGNGGWAGTISYPAMAKAVSEGYATASTDTGHSTPGASFAMGHPEKLIDFGYRSVHEMTVHAKEIIAAFYPNPIARSYWNGCSTGGRQGLMEAQRFPADFDGIVAGAPANYMSHLQPWSLWPATAVHESEASYIPPAKYPIIHKAAIEACDALDGVKDGVIEDPTRCHFDPKTIECKGGDSPDCLTAPQVEAARKLYEPARNPRTGTEIFPGFQPGSEMGWAGLAGPRPMSIPTDTFKYIVYNPNWDWQTIDFDKDVALLEEKFAMSVDAVKPDLSSFMNKGGKLIMYHGWNDQLIAAGNSIDYYNAVLYRMGVGKTTDSMRLYMVPGMTHCSGGDGAFMFDMLPLVEKWVEHGQAPDSVVASRKNPDRTRPLCPYPLTAHYKGSGSTDEAANFTCSLR